jgi:hypothetical protein
MAYVTLSEFKFYIAEMTGGAQTSYSTSEDALLQTFLNEAQADLETKTGRRFESVTATRRFGDESVYESTLLLDDDLISVTTLTNGDGAVIASTDYVLLPRNRTPKHGIRLINSKAWVTTADIQVAGSWGFSATPTEDVKRIVKRLAFFFWQKRTNTGENVVIGESAIQTAAEYPADIKAAILLHRREVFA